MVQRCCVPLCETKVGDKDIKGAKVRFHRIPLKQEKFVRWRDRITNSGAYQPTPELTSNSRICSKHFLREDYIADESQKTGLAGNHVLGNDAIPSVFHWNSDCQLSRAIPYVNKRTLGETGGIKSQEIQCSLQEEKVSQELLRKNIVIRQLLHRLAELEGTESTEAQTRPVSPKMPILQPESHRQRQLAPISPPPQLQLVPDVEECEEPPSFVLNSSTSTQTDSSACSLATQTSENGMNPPQRASVIRRLSDVFKPPKKRKFNFDIHF